MPIPDLLIKNARLPQGDLRDIVCVGDTIAAIEPRIDAEAHTIINAKQQLVSPPFVDCHFHLDATLSLGQPRLNRTGTLLEGIALWGELKPHLTVEAVKARALRYCELAITQGIGAIRSHVDICDDRLVAVDALLDVRRQVAPYLDLQLVAFPQDGYFRSSSAVENLHRALDRGLDIVGGIPHFERTAAEGTRSVAALCEVAARRGLAVDMHCDETDDPQSRHVETLCAEVVRLGLQGRATGSHLTSMHSMDSNYASKLIGLIAEADLHVVANPLINIVLQGRHDAYPKRRGMTRVVELLEAGVNVAFGQDCVQDPWYPLGSADMLDVAHMGLHVAQMTSLDGMRNCFEAVTTRAARVLGLERYGIAVGNWADFVVLGAQDPIDAIRLRAQRLKVFRRGKLLASSEPATAVLHVPKATFVADGLKVQRERN